jgi:hypothetical protein
MERLLAGEDLAVFDPPPGETERPHPHLERIVSHLTAAMGAALYEGEHDELISLALLACDVEEGDEDGELINSVAALLRRSVELKPADPPEERFPPSVRLAVAALSIARTPAATLPG